MNIPKSQTDDELRRLAGEASGLPRPEVPVDATARPTVVEQREARSVQELCDALIAQYAALTTRCAAMERVVEAAKGLFPGRRPRDLQLLEDTLHALDVSQRDGTAGDSEGPIAKNKEM